MDWPAPSADDFAGFEPTIATRMATNREEARAASKAFVQQPLVNVETGFEGVISNGNRDKMISDSAANKSSSHELHALAVANADELFRNAKLGWSKQDRNKDPNFQAIHRFFAPLITPDGRAATVKEMAKPTHGNPFYSVEAIEVSAAA